MGMMATIVVVILAMSWASMTRGIETHSRLLSHTSKISNTIAMLGASARMGAATGDAYHAHRYFVLVEDLDRQLTKALDLFCDTSMVALRDAIKQRSAAVMATSDEARAEMAKGNTSKALKLLDAPRTRDLRDDHIAAIGTVLYAIHEQSSGKLRNQRLNVLLKGLMLLLIIALTFSQILRRKAVEADLRYADAKLTTLRAAMGSAMDMQNNLLNNMVYFRTKAEMGRHLDANDIAMIDREIDASKAKMAELCAIENVQTRDIGGITILEPSGATQKTGMAFI